MKTDYELKLEHDNKVLRDFVEKLSELTYFSHRDEAKAILKLVVDSKVLAELKTVDELKRKLDSKYEDSISAILDYVFKHESDEVYNKVHETLFGYKSKIRNFDE